MYKDKYLKYKLKYLILKKQLGGLNFITNPINTVVDATTQGLGTANYLLEQASIMTGIASNETQMKHKLEQIKIEDTIQYNINKKELENKCNNCNVVGNKFNCNYNYNEEKKKNCEQIKKNICRYEKLYLKKEVSQFDEFCKVIIENDSRKRQNEEIKKQKLKENQRKNVVNKENKTIDDQVSLKHASGHKAKSAYRKN